VFPVRCCLWLISLESKLIHGYTRSQPLTKRNLVVGTRTQEAQLCARTGRGSVGSNRIVQKKQRGGRASGPVATPEDGRLPAGVRAPAPHLGVETLCVCDGMCACVWVCVSLGMVCFETTRVVSYAMSSVNVGVQKSYMTPQCFWMLSKKKQRETRLRNESKPNEGDRKYYSGPGYRGTRYPGRTFCFEICDPLSHMSVFHCICNFLSNVSPNTLPGGAR